MCSTPKASHPTRSRQLSSNYQSVFAGAGDVYRELEAKGMLRGAAAPEADEQGLLEDGSEHRSAPEPN